MRRWSSLSTRHLRAFSWKPPQRGRTGDKDALKSALQNLLPRSKKDVGKKDATESKEAESAGAVSFGDLLSTRVKKKPTHNLSAAFSEAFSQEDTARTPKTNKKSKTPSGQVPDFKEFFLFGHEKKKKGKGSKEAELSNSSESVPKERSESKREDTTKSLMDTITKLSKIADQKRQDMQFEGAKSEEDEDLSRLQFRKTKEERWKRYRAPPPQKILEIIVPDMLTLRDLARLTKISMKKLNKAMVRSLKMKPLKPHEYMDADTAELIGVHFDISVLKGSEISKQDRLPTQLPEDREHLPQRAPVACIMGHVNHGKTSLLDALRKTNVVDKEAGGITQGLGCFKVSLDGGDICFLDTPGHSVFRSMRSKGCRATDVVIILVSATDGVQDQTVESIRVAQDFGLPMIVAINKCDVDGVDPDSIKAELMDVGVVVEDLGGPVVCVELSAKTGKGLQDLEEAILVVGEMEDLRAEIKAPGEFVVVENKFQKGKGVFLNTIVRWGTLKVGDYFVCGKEYGRVRELVNCQGKSVKTAGPSTPVLVYGLRGEESLGEEGLVVKNEKFCRQVIGYRKETLAYKAIWDAKVSMHEKQRITTTKPSTKRKAGFRRRSNSPVVDVTVAEVDESEDSKVLHAVVKADTQGSLEAIMDYIALLPSDQVQFKVIKHAVGPINESDVAAAEMLQNSALLGFGIKPTNAILKEADKRKVHVGCHDVIYSFMDEVRDQLSELLPAVEKKEVLGSAEIVMGISLGTKGRKTVVAAGCKVKSGKLARKNMFRVLRDNKEIHVAEEAESMRHFKDTVESVGKGDECGVVLTGFDDYQTGDVLQSFEIAMGRPVLDDSRARGQRMY